MVGKRVDGGENGDQQEGFNRQQTSPRQGLGHLYVPFFPSSCALADRTSLLVHFLALPTVVSRFTSSFIAFKLKVGLLGSNKPHVLVSQLWKFHTRGFLLISMV
jgi:hypothetical protein